MVRYTLLRTLVFFGSLSILWLLGLRDEDQMIYLVLGAAALSAVISYFGLRRFREEYSEQLAARIESRTRAKAQSEPTREPARSVDEDAEDAETDGFR